MSTCTASVIQDDASKQQPHRLRLACELIGVCFLTSSLVSILVIVAWEQVYIIPDMSNMSPWRPMDDLVKTVLFLPLGFFIYWLHPAGWLFWLGLGTTLITRRRLPFASSIVGSAWFGYLWPAQFQALMGI